LFQKSRAWAERNCDEWLILSAKHGLVEPDAELEPYDETLAALSRSQRRDWAEGVFADLYRRRVLDGTLVFLAGQTYRQDLVRLLCKAGALATAPMAGLSIGRQMQWLGANLEYGADRHLLEELYGALALAEYDQGGLLRMDSHAELPSKGVYFFFEAGEKRGGRRDARVVRVGTHAVSQGSKSTLAQRLRAHRGVATTGGGSHRSSVFRSHVGAALIRRDGLSDYTDWGSGSTADKEIRQREEGLERRVSEFIGAMTYLVVAVSDEASARSDRAYIERNAIALLSMVGRELDPPSSGWLGTWSNSHQIASSGLWNIDHVGRTVDPRFVLVLRDLIRGGRELLGSSETVMSIAPADWWTSVGSQQRLELGND
jgi:hypothetical protein